MTIVHAPFGAAGFMEYPMIMQLAHTSDKEFFERVIAHEIGHTWLYGVLANNERKYPWMDEGLNSFLENEYMARYYENSRDQYFPSVLHGRGSMPDNEALLHMVREAGDLQPPMTDPVWQKNVPYILSAYELPAQGLRLLKGQVGADTLKAMFRNYFRKINSHTSHRVICRLHLKKLRTRTLHGSLTSGCIPHMKLITALRMSILQKIR